MVGAGFGGIAAVRALKGAPADVLLVDEHNYHLFQPLLYQVATALLDPSQIAYPVRAILRRQANADFLLAHVDGVDVERQVVRTDRGELPYDWCVVAAGAATATYGKIGVERHAFRLKTLGDALALRNHLLSSVERAASTSSAEERQRLLTVAIIGGGPTGVELAGAISELVGLVLGKDFKRLDLRSLRVVLFEGSDALLAGFAPRLRKAAAEALRRKGVELHFGKFVDDIDGGGLVLHDGERFEAGTVVWAPGVSGVPLGGFPRSDRDPGNRVDVDEGLHPRRTASSGPENVFVIGDLGAGHEKGKALPMLGAVAQQEGRWVAARILHAMGAGRDPGRFHYRDKGIMATIGRNAAVAEIGPLQVNGFIGWVLWLAVHLILLIGFRNRAIALVGWCKDYFFYDRSVRLIVAPKPPTGEPY